MSATSPSATASTKPTTTTRATSPPGHSMPAPSPLQKMPNAVSITPTPNFTVFSGHARQRFVDDDGGDEHDDQRGRGADRRQPDVALSAPERHHDEGDLEALEEHTLEGDGERVPVVTGFAARGAQQRDLGLVDRLFVVHGLEPAGAQDRLPQPLQTEQEQQGADDEPHRIDRQMRERRAEQGHDHRQREECDTDAPGRGSPPARHADGQDDGDRLDHLDRARQEGGGDDQNAVHLQKRKPTQKRCRVWLNGSFPKASTFVGRTANTSASCPLWAKPRSVTS